MRAKASAGLTLFVSCGFVSGGFVPRGAFGQSFEVASVKPVQHNIKSRPQTLITPGRASYTGATLRDLVMAAYGVTAYQVSGLDWLNANAYDIVAKPPADTPASQIPLMLQALLADRFQLTFHREKKDLPVYALVVNKGGPKLKDAAEGQSDLRISLSAQGFQAKGKASMPKLAEALSSMTDRPIVDLTELSGVYDIAMVWESDDPRFAAKVAGMRAAVASGEIRRKDDESNEDAAAVSLFAAVQQKLGLKLDQRKLAADTIVIDRANPVPSEN
jgi:uncharacterized protein (TIGR03435 family)